ncbi:MAG: carbohydrate binding domain-containing protein [Ignisphaera sp.]|nr:carbohydrate binding domain-containing protein [Ignisphaera sp.]
MSVKVDGTSGISAIQSVALTDKLGRRNYLINGNFDKWDYATSQTSSAYGSDNRWGNWNNGSTKTHSQQACGDTERALFNAMYFSRTVVSSSAGSSNACAKYQPIENVNLLAGKTVTLSFWAKADANKNIAIEFGQVFGSGGSPSPSVTGIGSQLVALTTTWQKKTITVTLPSIVGKTLGTDGVHTTFTYIVFWFDAGSNFATRAANLGQQSGTFDIAQVKLEDSSVATNGWHPYDGEFGGEIQSCARYYQRNFINGCVVQPYSSSYVSFRFRTQVPMRISATPNQISGTSLSSCLEQIGNGNVNATGISILAPKTNSAFQVDFSGSFNTSLPTTLSADIIEIGAELYV